MKLGLGTSTVLHAVVLSWGLITLSAPEPFDVAAVEALPVDIVPIESVTQIQKGDKEAPVAEKAAPKPTERPDPVEDAQNVGDSDIDMKNPPVPEAEPKDVEMAAAPKPAEEPVPVPTPDPVPEPEAERPQEPTPVTATEVARTPEARQEATPDPVEETIAQATPEKPKFETLPETVPTPSARPQPPQPQTAKTPERKKVEEPKEVAQASSAKESDFNADEIAALLNKQVASGGGAKRSQEQASLGGEETTIGVELSMSELDALRAQIQRCWSIIPGMADGENVRIRVTMQLDPSGAIVGEPQVDASGGSETVRRVLAGGARRAVERCAPYNLPAEKYAAWSDVIVNFDPSQMF